MATVTVARPELTPLADADAAGNPFLVPKRKPLVVGHRGVPALHQENTLAGFRRAVAFGLDAVELDVRLTRDHRAIVFHDANAERLTGVRRAIADLSWDEVSRLRIAPQIRVGVDAFGSPMIASYEREARIPLLAEVLAEVASNVAINIDVKSRWYGDEIASVVVEELAAARARDRILVTSFDPRTLREVARLDREIALGYCWEESPFGVVGNAVRRLLHRAIETNLAGRLLGTHALGVAHTLIRPETVRRLHRLGVAIGAHVLFPVGTHGGSPEAVARLVDLGVDWIESDDPARLQQLVS
jgi:glycerophosphoryl diester phosphodiesterase